MADSVAFKIGKAEGNTIAFRLGMSSAQIPFWCTFVWQTRAQYEISFCSQESPPFQFGCCIELSEGYGADLFPWNLPQSSMLCTASYSKTNCCQRRKLPPRVSVKRLWMSTRGFCSASKGDYRKNLASLIIIAWNNSALKWSWLAQSWLQGLQTYFLTMINRAGNIVFKKQLVIMMGPGCPKWY